MSCRKSWCFLRGPPDRVAAPGDRRWGASLLAEALRKLAGVDADAQELMGAVGNAVFDAPGAGSTRFEISADPSMLAGLRVGAWESYSLG